MLKILTVKVPYNKLLARLGYLQTKTKLDEKTAGLIRENLNLSQKLVKPQTAVAFENITISSGKVSDEILFESGYKIRSSNLIALLRDCFKVYGISVTIGGLLERRRDAFLKKKETFNALISDAVGSVAAEETIDLVNAQIKSYEEKNGNILTRRYSPGYGDWALEDNKYFLDWIGAKHIGIKLNEFCQMNPEKSISALIGVAKRKTE